MISNSWLSVLLVIMNDLQYSRLFVLCSTAIDGISQKIMEKNRFEAYIVEVQKELKEKSSDRVQYKE